MKGIINHIFNNIHINVWLAPLFAFFFTVSSVIISSLSSSVPAHAYSASLNTSSSVVLNTDPDHTTIHTESINVVSDCQAGYNLTISTSGNNKLYKNGDSTVTTGVFNPVNIGYALNDKVNNANTWGYSLINEPGTVGAFNPITTTPVFLRTEDQTRTEDPTIDDTFNLYYGVNIAPDTPAGSYKMANNGTIIYQLTMAESCNDNLEINFQANSGSDPVSNLPTNADNTLDPTTHSLILSTKRPARSGYIFREWNTAIDGTGQQFQPGDSIKIGSGGMSGIVDLYAVWVAECASATVCYDGNGADEGTMSPQAGSANTTLALIPSNFSRAGYGFAGWNTAPDGSGTQYGPNQNLKMPLTGGVNLFAQWLAPTGTLQSWAAASSMNVGDVIALKDARDNEVYTVAKLADNNVWIVENLRLVPNTARITTRNTNNPTSAFISAAPSSSSSTGQCYDDNTNCVDQVNFNAHNLNRNLTPAYNGATNDTYWYSYGVMYNWFTATAGNGTYSMTSGNAAGDLCPAGWHLPTGGSSGEWGVLANNMTGGSASAKAATLRAYPNNFLWSGDYNPSKDIPDGVGKQGRIWSTTPVSSNIKNAYRMGYNSSEITPATSNSWNKWDNFAVRCIYQGNSDPFADTTVSFAGTGVTSVSFYNENYGTETATTTNPTVSLALNVPYTVTAIMSPGYELSTWATTNTGTLSSTTTNPTTYTITDEATLTATGATIPSYTTTVTLPEHVSSITFTHPEYPTQTVTTSGDTVSLKRDVSYTITATFEEGYTLNSWTTSTGGSVGSTTSNPTTFTVTGNTSLSLTVKEAELLTYILNYDAGTGGSGAPASDEETSYNSSYTFTIDNSSIPTKFGHTFIGYSDTSGASTATYAYDPTNNTFTPSTISVESTGTSTTKTIYAVYTEDTCPAGYICYFGNGATSGTMANQSASSSASATLIPSNYARTGYGFAGWQKDAGDPANNIPPTIYGPNETITTPSLSQSGLKLYAKWVESVGNMQTWNGCNALTQGSVTALTDTRDNQTYAVAKLADDNCWTIENFRLDPATAINPISSTNTHNPTAAFITALTAAGGNTLSNNTLCKENSDACYNQIQYNANNLDRSLTQVHNTDGYDVAWYGYGVYYNWYTATAGNGLRSDTGGTNAAGDLCPINWHLPTGNSTGEYNALNTAINNGATNSDANWRKYPNNFVWSGDYNNTKRNSSYGNGRIWTATAKDNKEAYRIGYATSTVTASTNSYEKWDGFIMRCMRDESTVEYSDVTVTFPTGVDSITFKSTKYGEQTATPESPTVQLAEEATYTITANESMGYEFSSWTAGQGATLGDANQNPTTITITGDTTLSVTVQARPSYQVDVTIDEGVTSLGIYNANYGNQTLTPSTMTDNHDGTYTGMATLYKGIEYTITGTLSTGYRFSTWTTGANGTLNDATSLTTTYTVTGTSTLTLTTQLLQPPTTCNTPVPNITYMQDINDNNYSTVMASLTTDAPYYLRDSRDGEPYCVSKINNRLWMLDNLRLDLGDNIVLNNVNSSNTNASSTAINYLKNGGGTTSDQWPTAKINNEEWTSESQNFYSVPMSVSSGICNTGTYGGVNEGYCANDPEYGKWNKDSVPKWNNTERKFGEGSDKIGVYYNYCAASAGTYCWGDGTSYSGSPTTDPNPYPNQDNDYDIEGDICPIGWRIPGMEIYSSWYRGGSDIRSLYSISLTGMFASGWTIGQGQQGEYWSSWWENSQKMKRVWVTTTDVYWDNLKRNSAMPLRCVAIIPSHPTTVFLGSGVSSVTFANATYGDVTVTTNNNIANLKHGINYNITATMDTGYEFSAWSTGANGTLVSTTNNPTTYTVTDSSTLSATAQVAPSYTVTVNMDSNVNSVGFYNADLGTQTATTTNNTVTLYRNVPYTITGSYNQGYEFASWSSTGNGTLTDATANTTTYTVTGTSTLNVTSQILQPPATCNTPVPNITYMQDITTSNKTAVLSSLTEDAPYYLRDNRDNETYCVSKLKDGNLWMIDNLRLDLTNSIILNGLTTTNTHVDSASLTSLKSGNRSAGARYASSGFVKWDSSSSSNVYNQAKANADYKDTTTTSYGPGSGKIGVYYNYCAASAGSYCYDGGSGTGNASYDLCPAGWRMPTGSSSGEYQALYTAYSSDPTSTRVTLSTPLSGDFYIGSAGNQGSYGSFWSSTYNNGYNMGYLSVDSSNVYPARTNTRYYGDSLRCLLDPTQSTPSHTVTVNLDSGVTNVNFTSPLYGTQNVTSSGPVTLYENTPYTITATTATGYEFNGWVNGANSTIGSTSTNPTTYTITGNSTLSINTTDNRILINYNGNGLYYNNDPTDTNNQVYYINTTSSFESISGIYTTPSTSQTHVFLGWSENQTATTPTYTDENDIIANANYTQSDSPVTLYAIYEAYSYVTVNLDSHISSVTFTDGITIQTATSSSPTVSLKQGKSYTIAATITSGYEFSSWSTDDNGALGSTTTNPTTYTITDTSTLNITSRQERIEPPSTCSTPVPNITYMQEIDSSNYSTVMNSLTTNSQYYLRDYRDNKPYCVSKLQDDKLWMTSDLYLGSTTEAMTLTSSDTDTENDFILPVVETSENKTKWGTSNSSAGLDTAHAYQYNEDKNLYNWYTATAGVSYENSTATTSICPAGWKLLTKTKATNYLAAIGESSNSTNTSAITNPPLSLSDGFYNSTTQATSTNKVYWTANGYKSSNYYYGYYFGVGTSSGVNYIRTTYGYQKMMGLGVRCILTPSHNVTVNIVGSGVSSVNIDNGQTISSSGSTIKLSEDTPYTITANIPIGYKFISWTTTSNGVIDDSSANPANYTISGDTTLTVEATEIPSYTTTVNFDSNVTSINIYNEDYGIQTVTQENSINNQDGTYTGIVTLRDNIEYEIDASFTDGHKIGSWSTTPNGTIDNPLSVGTKYTVFGNTTLSLNSQEYPPIDPPTDCPTKMPTVTYMQDMNVSQMNDMAAGDSYYVLDKRDNQPYCVSRLADGKLWMTTNLNIAGGTRLSSKDTNLEDDYVSSFTTSNNLTKSIDKIVLPGSSTSGFSTNNYSYVYNSGNSTNNCASPGCYSYYSWDAATLGSSRTGTTDSEAPYSVCPKGWKLPSTYYGTDNTTDFKVLINELGGKSSIDSYNSSTNPTGATILNALMSPPNNFPMSGTYSSGSFNSSRSGYWSSSNSGSSTHGRALNYYTSSTVSVATGDYRSSGNSVRCLLDTQSYAVTVNFAGSGITRVSFNDGVRTQNVYNSGNTVDLISGVEYTITAATNTGYEFISWTATDGGALSSTNTNPSLYTITDTNTLTVTGQTIPSYDITVNLDSNIKSVKFYNVDYGTQNVSEDNSTVSLRRDAEYTISSIITDGYEFDEWGTAANGNLENISENPTIYTVTDESTLTVSSRILPTIPTGCNTPVPNITYMQEINDSNAATVLSSLSTETNYYLYDNRDEQAYCVSKLKDGNLWMIDNLRLDITDPDTLNSLSETNTNVDSTSLISLKEGNRSAGKQYATYGSSGWGGGASYETIPLSYTKYKNTVSSYTTEKYGNGSHKYGIYYNYCAASAGSYCFDEQYLDELDDGIDVNDTLQDAAYDICPSNWRMPTGSYFGEFGTLYNYYKTSQTATSTASLQYILSVPIYGSVNTGYIDYPESSYIWSSTHAESLPYTESQFNRSSIKELFFKSDTVYPSSSAGREFGGYIRCLLKPVQSPRSHTVTVNLDSNITGISITSPQYGVNNITTSGDTVTLYENVRYYLSASLKPGYEFTGWTTGASIEIDSSTYNPTEIIVTDDTTISATSQLIQPASVCNTPLPNYTYLQEINHNNYNSIVESLEIGSKYYLRDERDGEPYCIGKLKDDNLWLLDNLRLDPTKLTQAELYGTDSHQLTNASNNTLGYLKGTSKGTESDQYATSAINKIWKTSYAFTDPLIAVDSITSGVCNNNYCMHSDGSWSYDDILPTTINNTTSYAEGKIGVYYNYCAASAGSYCYSSTGSTNQNVSEDLCPAGWRMPTGGAYDGELYKLKSKYSYSSGFQTALNAPFSGDFSSGKAYYQGAEGRFWSSTTTSGSTSAWTLFYNNNSVNSNASMNRSIAGSMRCVLDAPTSTVTVSFPENEITSVTIRNGNKYHNISTSGTTVNLIRGLEYTITANGAVGYEFNSWSTDANGILSSTTTNPSTYTITGDSSLSVTGQEIPSYQVTINPNSGISSVSFTNTSYGTQTAASSNHTVSLRRGVEYVISATTNTGFEFNSWSTSNNGTLGSTTNNPTTYTITSDSILSINTTDNRILINYDGNGLYYNNNPTDTNNQVYYANTTSTTTETVTRYSHTPNVSDAGVASGTYSSNLDTTDTVTIDGAKSLNVTVYYDAESTTYDWLSVYKSPFDISSSNDSSVSTTTGNLSGKLSGRNSNRTTNYSTWYSKTYTVTGNTVKFHFISDSSQQYYGYYAIVTADVATTTDSLESVSGAYATPSSSQTHVFLGWSENQNATTPTYTDENDIIANASYTHSDSPVTLYAIYDEAYSDVTVSLDSHIDSVTFEGTDETYIATSSSPTVILKQGKSYTITATIQIGYELISWSTTADGSLGSINTNPTTYTVTGDTTLTTTSQEIPSYTTTVDFVGSGISSVSFTNAIYGTQNITNSGDTVSLRRGASYIVTTSFTYGYRFVSYATSINGILSSTSSTPTTYAVNNDSTLTITSEAYPTYTVTVNMDSNVSSIDFYNATYGTQTVTTTGSTVALYENVTYVLNSSYAISYGIDSWTTTSNGSLGSATNPTTTYTVSGTATLTLASQQEAVPSSCPSAPYLSGVTYMQDITSSDVVNMIPETTYRIKDSRDNQIYCMAKLADNKVWMTSNLNLAGGTALSANDTDVDSSYISSFTTSNNLTKTGDSIVLPASTASISGFDRNNYSYVANSGYTICVGNRPCYSYYSWDAATLGSGRSISTNNTDAPHSICPKNWRLPTSRTTDATNWQIESDFYTLAHQYGLDSAYTDELDDGFYTQAGPGTAPNFPLAGGYLAKGEFYSGGLYGFYWSATSYSDNSYARLLGFTSTDVGTATQTARRVGRSVRCVLDD